MSRTRSTELLAIAGAITTIFVAHTASAASPTATLLEHAPSDIIAWGGNWEPAGDEVTMILWVTPDTNLGSATWYGIDGQQMQSTNGYFYGFVDYDNTTQGCTTTYFSGNIKYIYVEFSDQYGNIVNTAVDAFTGC
jgi:hypothetical protein